MNHLSRRQFVKGTLTAALSLGASSRIYGANEAIRVGIVGFHGRGKDHIEGFRKLEGVRIVALCDVDSDVLAKEAKAFADRNEKVDTYTDVRKLLENKDIDAISIATPNHTHALIAIWGCQAGKDVYVEKPVCHNVFEGRKLVEAARKYNRIVQAGTQNRSNPGVHEAIQYVRDGNLGKLKLARALVYKPRPSIGKVSGDQPIPKNIDYDLWSGPAPLVPLRREHLHYDWHWIWDTGNGDLGNQGIHEMDMARLALGENTLSPRVMSLGGRFGYDDDGQTPNTQIVYHEYEKVPLICEVRGLPTKPGAAKKSMRNGKEVSSPIMDQFKGLSIGPVLHCEGGYVTLGSNAAYDNKGARIKQFTGSEDHFANFIRAVRSRKASELKAEILEGHISSSLCHTGNISYRLGKQATAAEILEQIKAQPEAAETFGRFKEHLGLHSVDFDGKTTLGPWLKMDPATEKFIDNPQANALLTREYRKPFVVPSTS